MTTFTDETAEARKQKKEHRRAIDFAESERQRVINTCYATHEGRTYLWWLLELSGFTKFVHDNQLIRELVITNPEAFATLITERFNGRRNDTTGNGTGDLFADSDGDAPDGDALKYSDLRSDTYE